MRRMLTTLALLLVAAASGASPAFGQEDGVTLDPSAPAAKEYALPVEQARREASGEGDAPVAQGSRSAEPFGAGVTPDAQLRKKATSDSTGGSGSGSGSGSSEATSPSPGGSADGPAAPQATTQKASASMGSTAVLLGGGLATLLVAGLGGFALRAVRGPTDA